MSSISGLGSTGSAWGQMPTQGARQARMQERMFQKADSDGSGGIDATELQAALDTVSEKTGASLSTSAADLLTQSDSNGDGVLSSDEMASAMQSVMPPPPSTMEFAQTRSGQGGGDDDLFGKVDTDGNGSISESELQSLMDKMASDGKSTTSGEAPSASDMIAKLDTDGDGALSESEFAAGKPQGGPPGGGMGEGMRAMGGMPPPPPGGMGGASDSASSSGSYDPLDTNQDGVVSMAERLAGGDATSVTDLFKSIDSDGDGTLSSTEVDSFMQQLTEQYSQVASGNFSTSTGSNVNAVV